MLFIALIGVSLLKLKCWNLIRSGLFSIFQITLSFSPLHSAHSLDKIEPIDNEHHVNSELFTILRSSLIWGLIVTPCTIKCCSWPKKAVNVMSNKILDSWDDVFTKAFNSLQKTFESFHHYFDKWANFELKKNWHSVRDCVGSFQVSASLIQL